MYVYASGPPFEAMLNTYMIDSIGLHPPDIILFAINTLVNMILSSFAKIN